MLIILRFLFLIICISIPFNVLALDSYYEDDLKKYLLQSRNILETAEEKVKSSRPADGEIKELSGNLESIKAYQVLFQERLNKRLEAKGTSASDAVNTHMQIVKGFNETLKEYINIIESISPESPGPDDNKLLRADDQEDSEKKAVAFDQQVIDELEILLSELLFEKNITENQNPVVVNLSGKDLNQFAEGEELTVLKNENKKIDIHKQIMESAKEMIKKIDQEKDISASMDDVMNAFKKTEAEEVEMNKKFRKTDEKLRAMDSPKIKERYRKVLEDYRKRSAEFREHMKALKSSNDNREAPEIIKKRLNGLVEFLDKNMPKEEYVTLGGDSGLPWRADEPGEIVLLGDTQSISDGNVSAVTAEPPTGDDLSETIDVQITREIQDLADSLGNDPLEIYRYVYNNYDYEPYYGSFKGSLKTYWDKAGNDYDLASLLIALLRASNIPSRYVVANVIMTIEQAMALVDINDPMSALQYIATGGFPSIGYMTKAGAIAYARMERVYVEAYVPYSNYRDTGYRGVGEDAAAEHWIPLDPSMKKIRMLREGIDITSEMGFEWKTFFFDYIRKLRSDAPMKFYLKRVENYVADNYPEETVDTLKRMTERETMQFDFLPNTLPYKIVETLNSYSEVPREMRGTVRFRMGASILDYTANLPEILGRRVTLSYEGATEDDQYVIDSFGGIVNTPPYLIEVKGVLRVDGLRVAEGTAQMGGSMSGLNVGYKRPGKESETSSHRVTAGSYNAIGVTVGKIRPELMRFSEVDVSEDAYMSRVLHSLVMKYHDSEIRSRSILNDTMKMQSRGAFSEAQVATLHDRGTIYGGVATRFDIIGMMIDAKSQVSGIMPVDGYDKQKQVEIMMMGGVELSYQENKVFEDNIFWSGGLSAIKAMQALRELGVGIVHLEPPYLFLWPTNLPASVVKSINDAINEGMNVIAPMGTGGLPVVPYIEYDPETGGAGYMISFRAGGQALFVDGDDVRLIYTGLTEGGAGDYAWEITKVEYQALSPASGQAFALGSIFNVLLRRLIIVEYTETGETEVFEKNGLYMPVRTGKNWMNSSRRSPMPWSAPGYFRLLYDDGSHKIFDFYVWGIELISGDKHMGISIENGVDTVNNPVNITYEITDDGPVNLSSVEMIISGSTGVVRTIDLGLNTGTNTEEWDGKNDSGQIVQPGIYNVLIRAVGSGGTLETEEHEVAVFKVVNVTALGATGVSAVGDPDIVHFLTPKASGDVTIEITITPDRQDIRDMIAWDGAVQDLSNQLRAKISKASAGKNDVKIKIADKIMKELIVWVVWSDQSGLVVAPKVKTLNASTGIRVGTSVSASFYSTAKIDPVDIITNADRPDLKGINTVNPPGGNNSCGSALSGGVNAMWDMSRRIAIRASTTANNPPLNLGCVDNQDNIPTDMVVGNDDAGTGDENNNPYTNSGSLTSIDTPTRGFTLQGGNIGDTYTSRLWFQEFVRLQIGNTWHVISEPLPWRVEFHFIKNQVMESLWGVDVNGDGDQNDPVSELDIGQDTNGDGDQNDMVGYWDNNNSSSANDNANIPK